MSHRNNHHHYHTYSANKKRRSLEDSVWGIFDSPMLGSNKLEYFGTSVSMSADGKTVAVGATGDSVTCYVKILTFSSTTNSWNQLGTSIVGAAANDKFGYSVSISSDGNTVAVGAPYNGENGKESGHVQIFTFSPTTNNWDQLGNTRLGVATNDRFGTSVSLSSDGRTVAVGAPFNDDTGQRSGHVRIFAYSAKKKRWDQLGSTMVGEASDDEFGYSVSLSADGRTVAIGAPNNELGSGHVKIFTLSSKNNWYRLGNT